MRLIDADEFESYLINRYGGNDTGDEIIEDLTHQPTVDAVQVVRCKDCRWWDKKDGANYGYCHAAKHGYFSKHWEISIYRTYKPDFFCADGERRSE
jgi:hypothetical protein